jgi:hypothetical protein
MNPNVIMYIRIAAAIIELLKDKEVSKNDVLHVAEGLGIDIPTIAKEDEHALEIVIKAITGIFK